MKKLIAMSILFVLAFALIVPAGANLVGTAFGFPTITQTGTTTAFNRDTAAATDTEALAIAFPNAGITDLLGNPAIAGLTLGLPTIAQTVAQTQVLTHCDFATTTETAAFAYPFVGVGGVCIPGFGFGF
jgi:phosphohistidine swiveling domain-containing protein